MTTAVPRVGVRGTVRSSTARTGYGLIVADDDARLLVHVGEVVASYGHRDLTPGQRVEFDVMAGDDGRPHAVGVIPLGRAHV